MSNEDWYTEIGNHQKVRRILNQLSGGIQLPWFDEAQYNSCRQWLLLANNHLGAANHLESKPRLWRSKVSRCYYAAYSASRCIRWFKNGSIKKDSEDHKHVGDLPNDFPDNATWGAFLVDLHNDRNLADYECGKSTKKKLKNNLETIFPMTKRFVKLVKEYITQNGVQL